MRLPIEPRGRARNISGFSLLDLLIGVTLFLIPLMAIYLVFEANTATSAKGEVKANIQQTGRLALATMGREFRMAGFGVPAISCPGTLPRITDARRRSVTIRADLRNAETTLTSTANAGATALQVNATTEIAANDAIYLTDGQSCEARTVQSVGTGTLTLATALTGSFAGGSRVYRPKDVTFTLGGGRLLRDERNPGATASAAPPALVGSLVDQDIFRYYDSANTEITTNNPVVNPDGTIRRIKFSLWISDIPAGQQQQNYTLESDVQLRNL